jgi:hypothetical protein
MADLIANNRKLIEDLLYRVRRMELGAAIAEPAPGPHDPSRDARPRPLEAGRPRAEPDPVPGRRG